MLKMIRRYFIAGVVFWIPIVATGFIVKVLLQFLAKLSNISAIHMLTSDLGEYGSFLVGISIVFVFFIFSGLLVANFIGRRLVGLGEKVLQKIPLVRGVYTAIKQSLGVIFSEGGKSFRQVVLVRFPNDNSWSMALVTNRVTQGEQDFLTVFIPTTPNPTSGFILFVPVSDTKPIDVSVDEALKFVITLGTATPDNIHRALIHVNNPKE